MELTTMHLAAITVITCILAPCTSGSESIILSDPLTESPPGISGSCPGPISSPIPVVVPWPGWTLNCSGAVVPGSGPSVVLEVVLDLVCRDSRAAWQVMKDLRDAYDARDLCIVVRTYELPYHRNAFVLSQGFHYIHAHHPSKLEAYVDLVYSRYDDLNAEATRRQDDHQVISYISTIAMEIGIRPDEFLTGVESYYRSVKNSWKHSARRGVAGTPWFFVNGVELAVDPNEQLSLSSWTEFIDTLLARNGET